MPEASKTVNKHRKKPLMMSLGTDLFSAFLRIIMFSKVLIISAHSTFERYGEMLYLHASQGFCLCVVTATSNLFFPFTGMLRQREM